jgi:3-phosphoshikimate 1-carboxyvinyltransferase
MAVLPIPIILSNTPIDVTLPGSKSITNRALLLSALSSEYTYLQNALVSEDTQLMVDALKGLGMRVELLPNAKSIIIEGRSGEIQTRKGKIFVGNAGTVARFLPAVCALRSSAEYTFLSSHAMQKRPMGELIKALEQLGARFTFLNQRNQFPFVLRSSNGLSGGVVELDATISSQFISGLMFVAPFMHEPLEIRLKGNLVSKPSLAMTIQMMQAWGVSVDYSVSENKIYIPNNQRYTYTHNDYHIEPDATAASYFVCLAVATQSPVRLRNFTKVTLQGEVRFLIMLEELGLIQCTTEDNDVIIHPKSLVCVTGSEERPLKAVDFTEISDTFLSLAAIAPILPFDLKITGIHHTRHKETDRLKAVAEQLSKLGQDITEGQDTLTICRRPITAPASISTYNDHRMAMSFAILGCHNLNQNGRSWLTIEDPECCNKTYPEFFNEIYRLCYSSNEESQEAYVISNHSH